MENIYLELYNEQNKKLHKEKTGDIDLKQYQYLMFDEPYYLLKSDYLIGRIDHKKTFGFLRQDLKDVYIDQRYLSDAMHDDIVIVKDGTEPKVVLIIKRALTHIIATVRKTKRGLFFEPDTYIDKRLEVESDDQLVSGHVVMLEVEAIESFAIFTKLKKIIGHINDPDINTLKIVYSYDWPTKFQDEVMDSLNDIRFNLEEELTKRVDLTNELIITIDGLDAKDLDDAISLQFIDNKYHLGVHIADVSHYVKEDSPLDQEALKRSTSCYLADRVIPMLPHKLSNDLCSLNPDEIKLTLSCKMIIDIEGKVISYDIFKSFIKSKRRMNYGEVNSFLKNNQLLGNHEIENMLILMNELSLTMKKIRRERGEIEFQSLELGFKVDENGKVLDIYQRKTDDAEELIESFMLLANETIAFHMFHADLPSIYRIHDRPDIDKLRHALQTIAKLGLPVNMKHLGNPRPLQVLTKNSSDSPLSYVVHMTLLRAMQKAVYSEINSIHYGLGARYYTHFTSPIRRYPDLILHRMIHRLILGESIDLKKDIYHFESILPAIAKHTSDQERKAIQMERDVSKLKSVEFMQDKIGSKFKAMISQMMPSGMFIKLENGIEGFVPLRLLDEYFMYDESNLTFVGSRGKKYRLGDMIKVELMEVDLQNKKMDFMISNKKEQFNKGYKKHENYRKQQKS